MLKIVVYWCNITNLRLRKYEAFDNIHKRSLGEKMHVGSFRQVLGLRVYGFRVLGLRV